MNSKAIAKLLVEEADVNKITRHLSQLAENRMDIFPTPEHSAHVANLLLKLVEGKT
ncbi:MAG: hypothetical protein L3J13_00820 [Devosiaceae bacterium]|nr:hypothetical protein [Devosiaceae bacterium]